MVETPAVILWVMIALRRREKEEERQRRRRVCSDNKITNIHSWTSIIGNFGERQRKDVLKGSLTYLSEIQLSLLVMKLKAYLAAYVSQQSGLLSLASSSSRIFLLSYQLARGRMRLDEISFSHERGESSRWTIFLLSKTRKWQQSSKAIIHETGSLGSLSHTEEPF